MNVVMVGPFGLRRKGTMNARALPIARVLAARGHRVTVLVPAWDSPTDAGQEWEDHGVRVVNVSLPLRLPLIFHVLLTLRLVRVQAGRRTMTLLTSVLDRCRLRDADVVELYRRRWGIELLYRSLKQTLRRRKMLSGVPEHAELELDWAMVGLWLLGLMTAKAAGREVRRGRPWSLAAALSVVRGAMRRLGVARAAGGLRRQLRLAVRDRYVRHRPKEARYWPRKKNEHPPGAAKIRTATHAERQLAQEFRSCLDPN